MHTLGSQYLGNSTPVGMLISPLRSAISSACLQAQRPRDTTRRAAHVSGAEAGPSLKPVRMRGPCQRSGPHALTVQLYQRYAVAARQRPARHAGS